MALIPPIGAGSLAPLTPSVGTQPLGATSAADSSAQTQRGTDFGKAVASALDDMQTKQLTADQMAKDAATGKLQNVEDYMIAASDAQLSTQLTVAVRNKALDSFNEIMRMTV